MQYTAEQRRVYQAEYRRKRRARAIEHLGGKCRACGTTDDLEFNHRDPREKDFNLGKFWGKFSDYWKELEKCELLCKPCHVAETKLQYEAGLINTRIPSSDGRALG